MRLSLYIVFTISGAAGLVYEMIWARYLSLFLGHSAYAQILVITIFLGGMALGALAAGWRTERLRDPLKWYAVAELLAGCIGVAFHDVFVATTDFAYATLFPVLAGSAALTPVKFAIAAALILPQSVLLGTTFPLMAAGLMRRDVSNPGRTLAVLYFANSFGAAAGVLIAGFYLVAAVGLPGTLLTAAALNVLVAVATLAIADRRPGAERLTLDPSDRRPLAEGGAFSSSLPRLRMLMLGVAFGTAVASFGYEIGWLRMLALVLGSATHSFELMLSAFIAGLAAGALWVRGRADRWQDPARVLAQLQILMGLAALSTLPLYAESFAWIAKLMDVFTQTDVGYAGFNLARYAICLTIMFPASFFAGTTLPLITRTLLVAGDGERSIGRVYGVNTLGSILGVSAAGAVLLPALGLKGLIVAGATLDMGLGLLILLALPSPARQARKPAWAPFAVVVAASTVAIVSEGYDPRLLASGVFRRGDTRNLPAWENVFYADGRTASVAVERVVSSDLLTIRTNGKPDASIPAVWREPCRPDTRQGLLAGDMATQALLPLITLAHQPEARTAAVIDQGSGLTSHILLGGPRIEELVTIEIEPEMIAGSRELGRVNRRVFDDPRSTLVIDDAKTYLASADRRFDLILSEPSNPWVSGVSSLFTVEFYERVREHIGPGGVFGQWLHLYEMNDGLVLTVLAALHQTFGAYEIFQTQEADLLIVATPGNDLPAPDWSITETPPLAEDLCHAPPLSAPVLESTRLTHRAALAPLLDNWEAVNSDFYPLLDLGAERARYLRTSAEGIISLRMTGFDFTAALFGRRATRMEPDTPLPLALPRVRALAGYQSDGGTDDAEHRAARLRTILSADEPPASWRLWMQDFAEVERDRHLGTAGYVDDELFERVLAFVDRHDAPENVRDVVVFRYSLNAWDFETAAAVTRRLATGRADVQGLIETDLLLSGGVTALLMGGDEIAARALHTVLSPRRTGNSGDLRRRLLDAYLQPGANPAARGP